MITYDLRVLVREGRATPDEVLTQLLSGVLRVHAVVELSTLTTAPNGESVVRPVEPVYRNPRSTTHYAVARDWSGEVLA